MKKKMLIVVLSLLCLALTACSPARPDTRSITFRSDVDPDEIAARMVDAIGGQGVYMEGDDDLYDLYFAESEGYPLLDDACMMFAREETNVSELGVFRVDSAKATDKVKALVQSYLAEQQDYLRGFAKNYSPEDMNKIDNAAVTVKGCYVIYYILSPEDEAKVLDAIENLLVE